MSTVPPPPPPQQPPPQQPSQPPPMQGQPAAGRPVPNHLAWAIVATILGFCLCCPSVIPGVVAIVFAARVNTKLDAGDLDGARRDSDNAKLWCWVTTGLAIVGLLLNLFVLMTGGMEAYMQMMQSAQY